MLDESDSEIEARLARLYAREGEVSADEGAHARLLEQRLLDAFDDERASHAMKKERPLMKNRWFRRGLWLAAASLVLAACAAPVDVDVEIGRSLSIHYDGRAQGAPRPDEIAQVIGSLVEADAKAKGAAEKEARDVAINVQLEGATTILDAEIWGGDAQEEAFGPRVKQAFPALATAIVHEEMLHAKVRESFAKKLGHDLLDLEIDHGDVETAKKRVMEQLRARGVQGKVDVQVQDGEHQGERKVIIKVEDDPKAAPAK